MRRGLATVLALAAALAACSTDPGAKSDRGSGQEQQPPPEQTAPKPDASIPREPRALAARLAATHAALAAAIESWRTDGGFGVQWPVLAAVNFVESAFGRMRNSSAAGAQGPMQFIPSTWDAYGMGGDVNDPHDAIMGAANYLSASGAPGDLTGALYAYNPSDLYVRAVLAYAGRIRRDRDAFLSYYSWQVFVRQPDGTRRITG